uniref:DNA-directed DNA polymerase n=1 Tax=Meloidogyne incognita TaxID=6306 RepID=A0A914KQ08_MELIC
MSSPPKRARFSIDDILDLNERPRQNEQRTRPSFFIENLILNDTQEQQNQIGAGGINHCFEKINSQKSFCKKFKLMKLVSKFLIKSLPQNPEEVLRRVLDNCIKESISDAKENGILVDQLGATISSTLLDNDIWIPIRTLHDDTIENILQRFLLVSQSKAERGSLLGEPFTVTIHSLDVSSLPKETSIGGKGPTNQSTHIPSWLIKVWNNNNFCLFYALELTRKHVTKELGHRENFRRYHQERFQRQQSDVINLMKNIGIPLNEEKYEAQLYVPKVVDYWNNIYEKNGYRFKVFIFGERCEEKLIYKYGSETYNTPIPIYHSDDHFDGIRTVGAQFGINWQYCYSCEKKYRRAREHDNKCKSRCRLCGRVGVGKPCPVSENFRKECIDCGKTFWDNDCFKHHKSSNQCNRSKQCDKCGIIWDVKTNRKQPGNQHICGHKWCANCLQFHSRERGCFIKPLEQKKQRPYRLVTFDFEATQDTTDLENQNNRLHCVNFIAATITCTICMENKQLWGTFLRRNGKVCTICGPNRSITFSHRPFHKTQVDEQRVTLNPLHDFVNWLLFELDGRFISMAFSHFGGRYDMIMTFREIFTAGIVPSMIRRGNKLYELKVPKTHKSNEVIFRDSYNICPVALGQLVGAFDLQIQEKQFFPHMANNYNNYDVTLPELPQKSEYLYGGMTPEKQKKFDQWYEQEKCNTFCLNEALAEYCLNDVQILTEALLAFRDKFMEISRPKTTQGAFGIDILRDAMTIASACMKHFRLNHLKPEHLAIVPEKGYDTCDTQSALAMKYMDWYSEKYNVEIQTAHSENGEYQVAGRFKVDGYIKEEDRAIEVHGCVWHACPRHYGDKQDFVMPNGKTVEVIQKENEERLRTLKQHISHVDVVWECEIKKMLQRNKQMRRSFKNYLDKGPIKLRDCFFGGRTGPLCLHYKADEQHKISYLDFNSLYPSTIATTSFPVGHPKVIIISRKDQNVNWLSSSQIPVNGILKVFLIPPDQVDVPVMPVKFDERLLFPLCRKCSMDYPRGATLKEYKCKHEEQERGWVSTCTSIELAEALDSGYKVTKYFRALHYEKWDKELFKGYVAEFMSMKIHASGFPKEINTTEKEEQFMKECEERFGIQLEREKMLPDKAMRYISKLMLNSLWGRFSLRNTLSKTFLTDSPAELKKFMENKSIEVNTIDKLTQDTILITYDRKNEFIEEHQTSNIVISLWTTSMARVHLLKAMQKIVGAPGCSLLYGDTDSVLFSYPKGQECPLSAGPHLGDLAPEYDDCDIKEYVGAACKAYGLSMKEKKTGKEVTTLKVRGITLNSEVCKKLHYESFKESVMEFGKRFDDEREGEEEENNEENDVLLSPKIKLLTLAINFNYVI